MTRTFADWLCPYVDCMLHAIKHYEIYWVLHAKKSMKRAIVLPLQNFCAKPGKKWHDDSHHAKNCIRFLGTFKSGFQLSEAVVAIKRTLGFSLIIAYLDDFLNVHQNFELSLEAINTLLWLWLPQSRGAQCRFSHWDIALDTINMTTCPMTPWPGRTSTNATY